MGIIIIGIKYFWLNFLYLIAWYKNIIVTETIKYKNKYLDKNQRLIMEYLPETKE